LLSQRIDSEDVYHLAMWTHNLVQSINQLSGRSLDWGALAVTVRAGEGDDSFHVGHRQGLNVRKRDLFGFY
jgi:hypothetical protein